MGVFGNQNTSVATTAVSQDKIEGTMFTMNAEDGTADSIDIALKASVPELSVQLKCCIYQHGTLALVGTTEERTVTLTNVTQWFSFNFTAPKPAVSANVVYILVGFFNYAATVFLQVRTGSTVLNEGHGQVIAYGAPPNPLVPGHSELKFSIHCHYTPAALPIAKAAFSNSMFLLAISLIYQKVFRRKKRKRLIATLIS